MLAAFTSVPAVLADEGKTCDKNKPACKEKAKEACPKGEKKGCCPKSGEKKTCPFTKDSAPAK